MTNSAGNSLLGAQTSTAPVVQQEPNAVAAAEQASKQVEMEMARRAQLSREIMAEAETLSASWVIPEGSTQPSTPVLHRMRAIIRLNGALSQREVSEAVGTSQPVISLYLRGRLRTSPEQLRVLEGKLVKFASGYISGEFVPVRGAKPGPVRRVGRGRGRPLSIARSGPNALPPREKSAVERERAMMERIRRKQIETQRVVQQQLVVRSRVISPRPPVEVREDEFRKAQEIELKLNNYRQMQEHVVRLRKHAQRSVANGARDTAEENGAEKGSKSARMADELSEMDSAAKEILLLENMSTFAPHDPELPLKKQYQLQRYLLAQQGYIMVQQEHLLQQQNVVLSRQRVLVQSGSDAQNIVNDAGANPDCPRGEVETSSGTNTVPPAK